MSRRKAKPRATASCAILDRCGGCSTQEVPYDAQLAAKRAALTHALSELCPAERVSPVQGISPFGYRTRLLMPAAPAPKRRPPFELGFYARGSTTLTNASGCPVQHPLTLATLAMVEQAMAATKITATSPRSARGWLHGVAIRVDPSSGAAEVTLVGRSRTIPGGRDLAERLLMLPGVASVHLSVNPARSSYLLGDPFVHLAGARRTIFHLSGHAFHLSPGSFLQTCAEASEHLAAQVLRALPQRISCLADLYGGVGVFARLSRQQWQRALVVESSPHAVGDLRQWIRRTGESSLRVLHGRVEALLDEVLAARPDVVILDPPRSGCHPRVLSRVSEGAPPLIVYVSCALDSLARDAAALAKAGYRIDRVTSVDMFPHTEHLEVVARFVWSSS